MTVLYIIEENKYKTRWLADSRQTKFPLGWIVYYVYYVCCAVHGAQCVVSVYNYIYEREREGGWEKK